MKPTVRSLSLLLFQLTVTNCQRLSQSVKPVHYDLVILPVITGDEPRLCGHVYIDFVSDAQTNVITLNALNLEIVAISLDGDFNETLDSRLDRVELLCFFGFHEEEASYRHHEDKERQQLDIIFKKPFKPATKHRLGILYKGRVNDEPKGFFRASYKHGNACCQR